MVLKLETRHYTVLLSLKTSTKISFPSAGNLSSLMNMLVISVKSIKVDGSFTKGQIKQKAVWERHGFFQKLNE